jgi:hypothetical protein
LLVPIATSGNYDWTARANGAYYFKCDVGSHCTAGGAQCPGDQVPAWFVARMPAHASTEAPHQCRRALPTRPPSPPSAAGNMVLPVTVTGCTTTRTADVAVSAAFTRGL